MWCKQTSYIINENENVVLYCLVTSLLKLTRYKPNVAVATQRCEFGQPIISTADFLHTELTLDRLSNPKTRREFSRY